MTAKEYPPCLVCGEPTRGALLCRDCKTPRYWVLVAYGYADTFADYRPANSRDEIRAMLPDYGYMANPGVTVFDGRRSPWDEVDPYPDYVAEHGPRGGFRWERA